MKLISAIIKPFKLDDVRDGGQGQDHQGGKQQGSRQHGLKSPR